MSVGEIWLVGAIATFAMQVFWLVRGWDQRARTQVGAVLDRTAATSGVARKKIGRYAAVLLWAYTIINAAAWPITVPFEFYARWRIRRDHSDDDHDDRGSGGPAGGGSEPASSTAA